jgi:hypothetical protein
MSSYRCLAVVPAYNESATVARVVEAIHRDAPEFDVLVVDDGSTDDTAQLARAAGASVLVLPFNLGIGGAVQAGYQYALERDYDIAVQVDGDGQHDARNIHDLLAHLHANPELGLVTGSRFVSGDEKLGYQSSASRRLGIRMFAWVLSRIVGRRVTDPTSGFRMVRRRGIALFARDYPHDYPEVEAVLMVHFHRLRMREVPVEMLERGGGQSSISSGKSVYYMIKVLLAIFVGLVRRRPVVEPGDRAPVTATHGI